MIQARAEFQFTATSLVEYEPPGLSGRAGDAVLIASDQMAMVVRSSA